MYGFVILAIVSSAIASPLRGIDEGLVETAGFRQHGTSFNEVHRGVSVSEGHHGTSISESHGVSVGHHGPALGGLPPRDIVSRRLPVPSFHSVPGIATHGHFKRNPVVGAIERTRRSPPVVAKVPAVGARSAAYVHTAVIATPAVVTPVLFATPIVHGAVLTHPVGHHARVNVHREVDYSGYWFNNGTQNYFVHVERIIEYMNLFYHIFGEQVDNRHLKQ